MSRRDRTNPLYRDVLQGSGGVTKGQFLKGADGTEKLAYNYALLQENGMPILQENGKYIYQDGRR